MENSSSDAASLERRRSRILLAVLVCGMLASLLLTVQLFWDARPDAARYLLAARSLANGDGYAVMGEPFRLRPPGFSLLLAPLVAWRGYDFAALNLYVSLFGVAAVVLLYLLLLPRVGAQVAFAVAVLVWLNPQLQGLCNQVLSDVPALALALLALLVVRWANRRATLGRDLALAVVLAAAVYVRSANLLLVPAFALDRLCRLPSARAAGEAPARFLARRVLLPLAVFTVLYLPWLLMPPVTSRYDSPDLQSYSAAFLRSDPNDAGAAAIGAQRWVARLEKNAVAYAAIFTSGMVTRRSSPAAPFVAGLGALALLAVLLRRREAPEWFAAGTVLMLIGYYVAATRLLLPAFVLTVAAMAESARWLLGRALAARTTERMVAGCLLLVAASTVGGSAQHADARARYESLLAATQHVRETVAAGRPLGGDVGAVYALLLDRPVYSLRPLGRRGKRKRLFKLLEERDIAALIVRREGPMEVIARRLGETGDEVVTLPHHVVVHLAGAHS